jgi:hypothetical protein
MNATPKPFFTRAESLEQFSSGFTRRLNGCLLHFGVCTVGWMTFLCSSFSSFGVMTTWQ